MPWTLPEPGSPTPGKYHCPTCLPSTGPAVRAGMHCGFMSRELWTIRRVRPQVGPDPYTADECPGWLVRQPAVVEAAAAYSAMESGILDRFDPRGLRVVTQAAMLAKRAFDMREAELQRKAAARVRNG